MSVYNLVSSHAILAKVRRDFGVQDSTWVADAVEWIGEATQLIGSSAPLKKTAKDIEVFNHRAAMPCGLEAIEAVQYEGNRLRYGGDLTVAAVPILGERTTNIYTNKSINNSIISGNNIGTQNIEDDVAQQSRSVKKSVRESPYYIVNDAFIITSFEEGSIRLYYQTIPMDNKGLPMIPDNGAFKEAITWFIIMKMLGRGMKHPVFDYYSAKAEWDEYKEAAFVSAGFPSPDRMESMMRAFRRMIPNEFAWDDFEAGTENREQIDI